MNGPGARSLALAALATIALGGCGIDAKNAVDDIFHVRTDTTPVASRPRTTTTATTATVPAEPQPVPAGVAPPPTAEEVAGETPATVIPAGTAATVAAKTASDFVSPGGARIPSAAWTVSCRGFGSQWTCPVSSGGCAGEIVVSATTSGEVVGKPEGLSCGR
ncbi:MAG: hypothetical protein QOG26_1020 [Solirubrobacterales bacterium]|nr:hypothetical protein [Solirubrobacterales bacterium]MDX6652247.1 hypothetical protein [Solirubrobacterales bacterium]